MIANVASESISAGICPVTVEESDRVSELAEAVCRAHRLELVEVRRLTQRGSAILRITIDRPVGPAEVPSDASTSDGSGVTLGDCEAVSRDLSVALDVNEEATPARYRLEVSSPGLERPLVRERDFVRFAGREAKIKTQAPIDGRRNFQGMLRGVVGGSICVEVDGDHVEIPLDAVTRAHIVHRF